MTNQKTARTFRVNPMTGLLPDSPGDEIVAAIVKAADSLKALAEKIAIAETLTDRVELAKAEETLAAARARSRSLASTSPVVAALVSAEHRAALIAEATAAAEIALGSDRGGSDRGSQGSPRYRRRSPGRMGARV